jgi:signal transduction histidine kinase
MARHPRASRSRPHSAQAASSEHVRFAPRLGRRLALAFAGSVVVTALILAVSSYALVMYSSREDARERAIAQARFNLVLADSSLPADPTAEDYSSLARFLSTRGDFATLVLAEDMPHVSGPGINIDVLTDGLRTAVERGRLAYLETDIDEDPALVAGGRIREGGPDLYFAFPLTAEEQTLARLRNVLLGTGLVLAFLGSLLGLWLSARVLRPVAQASEAAGRMARGDLDVRLPAGPGEFGMLSAAFNRMARNLKNKIVALEAAQARERRFTADVAHELRTPVAALVGEASLLERRAAELSPGVLPPETQRALELVVTDVDRLRRLVDDLLEISRIDAQAAEVVWEEFEVGDFLRRVGRARGWPDDVELLVATRFRMVTDRRRLERIVVNLVENALRHGAPPILLEAHAVRPSHRPAELELSVTDFGPGVSQHDRAHIFERFYKADPSRGATRGTGLGLAIAWENARLLGGALRLRSREGEGARFVLRLPLAPAGNPAVSGEEE